MSTTTLRGSGRGLGAGPARLILPLVLFVMLALPSGPGAAGYETALERGLFYLQRGTTYGPDAVRSLEEARKLEPTRAEADPRWIRAAARANALTARFTEAYWLLDRRLEQEPGDAEAEEMREWLLEQAGLGRLWLVSAIPVPRLTGHLEPAAGTRLDVTARKALDRLNELLARGVPASPGGLALLAPEGRYRFGLDRNPAVFSPEISAEIDVWAGDEARFRVVPRYPDPDGWRVVSGARSVSLWWPALDGATYQLYRTTGDTYELICSGAENSCSDSGLDVGQPVTYRLDVLNPGGEVVAASGLSARTVAPVEQIAVGAELGPDLRIEVGWALGPGAADAVRVVREDPRGDREVVRLEAPEPLGDRSVYDVPVVPAGQPQPTTYRVEAWVSGADRPTATGATTVTVPARVERVTEVTENLERGSVAVVWETFPRDGLAGGYWIYRQRGEGEAADRVGVVNNPFAREFLYPVNNPLEASNWRHFVVPYLGDRLILDPEWVTIRSQEWSRTFEKRARQGVELPDVGISWDPYDGAVGYTVTLLDGGEVVDDRLAEKPFADLSGLQTPLMGTDRTVQVHAVTAVGKKILVMTVDVRYEHYPREPREH